MDPIKVRNWALTLTAVGAVLGGGYTAGRSMVGYSKNLIAQEAVQAAQAEMRPAVEELGQIKELLRRQEDRDAFRTCMDYSHQDESVEVRNQICTRESNARWAWWRCEDETPKACGPQP